MTTPPPRLPGELEQLGLGLRLPDPDVIGIRRFIEERRAAQAEKSAPSADASEPAGGEPW